MEFLLIEGSNSQKTICYLASFWQKPTLKKKKSNISFLHSSLQIAIW